MKNKLIYLIGILLFYGAMPLMGSPPEWSLQVHNFANTSNIIANLQVNGVTNEETGNIIGFFVGNEVRAIAEPMLVEGDVFYFITTYSNELADEAMTMKVYLANDDAVYTSPETYSFQKSELLGSVVEPHIIRFYTDGDFPIALEDIPEQVTLQSQSFLTIDLNDYVIREDNDFINWAYQVNPDLDVDLSGSMLTVTALDTEWIGSTFLDLTATEVTSNQYSATIRVVFTVKEFFVSPTWDELPDHTAGQGELFPTFNLNDYEYSYDGNCLNFSVQPVIEIPDPWFSRPDWSVIPQDYQYTMTTIHKVQFSDYFSFNGTGDLLGAFVGNEVRGVASPVVQNGEVYVFITVYSNDQEDVTFKYYSQEYRNIYEVTETIMFEANFSNPLEEPIVLDVAPIKVNVLSFGGAIVYVCDEDWLGSQSFTYTVQDCNNPELVDVITVTYTVDGVVLPTDLVQFSGALNEKAAVDLTWEIAHASNLDYFEIERSNSRDPQISWTSLGKINAFNTDVPHFSFTDAKPLEGENYYRLKIVETSGEYHYSNIINIVHKTDNNNFNFYPNPVVGQDIFIEWNGDLAESAKLKIFDRNAQLVFQQEKVMSQQLLNLPVLPSGLYFLQVQTEQQTWFEKMIMY